MSAWVLVAIVPEAAGGLGDGLALERVKTRGLVGLVKRASSTPRPTLAALRRHEKLVRRLWEQTDALLPARFGEVFETAAALRRRLSDERPKLLRALEAVKGRAQLTLRLGRDGEPTPSPPAATGKAYLLARAERQKLVELSPIEARVLRFVRASRRRRLDHGPVAAALHHLVDRPDVEAYRAAALAAIAETGVPAWLSGPGPAWAFGPEEPL